MLTISGLYIFSFSSAFGHGLGLDTIKSIDVDGKEISITIEMPMYFTDSEDKKITVTATEDETKDTAKNVTFLIGLFHEGEMIFRNYFFAPEGTLTIDVIPTREGKVEILGQQDDLLGAWHSTESGPIQLTGPVFQEGGLYTFEIEVRTIDEPTNIIENQEVSRADVSIAETTNHQQKNLDGEDVQFRIKSYFDQISNFEYDSKSKMVTFEMPFDWSELTISHIPVVHEEVHFPKDHSEFFSPSYVGKVNGIDLFKSSVTIDDYTEEDERIVHFVLLSDHLKFLKNEQKRMNTELPENIVFTLTTSQEQQFPMTAYTRDEQFQIDLSWDPLDIEPNQDTNFVFTIRDGSTGEPLRKSTYDFIILQGGKVIHKKSGEATVGGHFEKFTFGEDQTGPTIIRFENIRGTGLETEFGLVVIPEFGTISILILIVAMATIVFLKRQPITIRK